MFTRFAEMWLVDKHRDYEFDQVVEQLTMLCGNAIGLKRPLTLRSSPPRRND
jgi:hypothetical protein